MTQEEKQKKIQSKVQAVEVLMRQLNLTVSAEQYITKEGVIKNSVFYQDNEKYPEEKPLPVENKDPEQGKKDAKTTNL